MSAVPAKMKALVFYEPEKMQLEEREVPVPGPDEILVKVRSLGICGSDVAYYYGWSSLETADGKGPLILGHEFSGEIVGVGANAEKNGDLALGDRVVINPVQSNPDSKWSRQGLSNLCDEKRVLGVSVDGGMAEYCVSDYRWAVKIPEGVTYEQAASTEPLACAVYAINNLNVEKGQFVVVFGPGPIGLMMVQLAKSRGASQVLLAGTRDYRLELGKKLGADIIVNTTDAGSPHYGKDLCAIVQEANGGELADRAITSTSSLEAIHQAIAVTGKHATVVVFGLPGDKDVIQVPALQTILMDKTLRFSWLAPTTWPEALQSIASGAVSIDPLQTHKFGLEGTIEAIAKVRAREDDCIKALVQISDG